GLSIILGVGETSLWELTGVYASLSRVLKRYNKEERYDPADFHPPYLTDADKPKPGRNDLPLSAASIWLTYEALKKVSRPESESGWQYFSSSTGLAWKTGTSFGFRDAWAVGTTPDYVIGVWAGNADGTGRPGLTGLSAAAPVLFELAGCLPRGNWFSPPYNELAKVSVCKDSGFRAGPYCTNTEETDISANGLKSNSCPYHKIIHLNSSLTYRVNAECANPLTIVSKEWFILPPAMEYYYRQKHPEYKPLPPVAPGCNTGNDIPAMEFIYPSQGITIFIPRDQSGLLTRVIAEVAHRNSSKTIYWHLDRKYLGTTKIIHMHELLAEPGNHTLSVVDEDGNSISCTFTITGKR
ncbi:MAG: penicillin-binding protein 1C, partial [Bacteroidales bacterium]|nr:penicillin-binding protein 1C [Bacteroidales bacterium]